MGAVSPLAGAEQVEPAGAVGERRPGGRGEAEGRAEPGLAGAAVGGDTVELPGLPQVRVLHTHTHTHTQPVHITH